MQRALKFVKYLPEFGYKPIVFTVANNQQLGRDESLLKDLRNTSKVYSCKIPLQGRLQKQNKSFVESKGFGQRIKRWLRGNVFLPDAKIGWLFKAKPVLKKIISENKIACVFVSAPPQTAHLLGHYIKKKYKLPTIHDFRDPWTDAFFLKDFNRGKIAHFIDSILERKVLKLADHVTTVSNSLGALLNSKTKISYTVISNGYDDELAEIKKRSAMKEITYTGTIADTQVPHLLFKYLSKEKALSLKVYGNVHSSFNKAVEEYKLTERVIVSPAVSHDDVLRIQKNAECLLLLIPDIKNSELIVTGKIFEYFASGAPILAFGKKTGDAAKLLEKSKLGVTFSYRDSPDELDAFFNSEFFGDLDYIKFFHRRELTATLAGVFDRVLNTL